MTKILYGLGPVVLTSLGDNMITISRKLSVKEGELYKVKTDPDSGYDLDSIELRVTSYAISGVVPRVIIIIIILSNGPPKSCEHRSTLGARSGGRPNPIWWKMSLRNQFRLYFHFYERYFYSFAVMGIYFWIEFYRCYQKFRVIRSIFHCNKDIFIHVCIGTLIA